MARTPRDTILAEEPRAVDPPRFFVFLRPETGPDDPGDSAMKIEQYCTLKRAFELDAREGWTLLYERVGEDEPDPEPEVEEAPKRARRRRAAATETDSDEEGEPTPNGDE